MRISDWSSDVCSSDLLADVDRDRNAGRRGGFVRAGTDFARSNLAVAAGLPAAVVSRLSAPRSGRRQPSRPRRTARGLLQSLADRRAGPARDGPGDGADGRALRPDAGVRPTDEAPPPPCSRRGGGRLAAGP